MPRTTVRPGATQEVAGAWLRRGLLTGILALAFVLRALYVLQSSDSPAFTQPSMDALYHIEWARAFARGEDFQPGPFFRAPLYPWFLGALFRLFGERILVARLVQAAIGTASVGLVYLVGARAFRTSTGLLAALFASIYWVVIYFEGELLLPVLEIFFDLLAIWLSLRIAERASPRRAALAGAAWGVAAIVRPNVLLFAPLVLAWVWLRARRTDVAGSDRSRLLAPLAFALALAAPIAPITAYNRIVGKDWVLVSSQGGVNFWIGNNPRSDGVSAIVPGTRPDWWGGYHDSIRLAEEAEGRPLAPSEVSSHYSRAAWSWIRSEPGAALEHFLWKLRLFFTDWELSNNTTERFFAYRFGPVLRFLPLGFVVLAPLALLGFALAARRWRPLFPLWGFLPVYTASVVAFFVCSRFRAPVLPVMAVLAAHACVELVALVLSRRYGRLGISAAFLIAAAAFVGRVPASIDRSDAKGLWELGVAAAQRGDLEAAVAHYRASIAANEGFSTSHQDLGAALRALGRKPEAEASLGRAIAIDPGNVVARGILVDLLVADGRLDEARPLAEEAARIAPVYAPAHYDLGRLRYLEAQALERAGADPARVAALREAALPELAAGLRLANEPETAFRSGLAAGSALSELGRPAEAAGSFEAALAARPERPPAGTEAAAWWWRCQRGLLAALAARGDRVRAAALIDELRARYPGDPEAASLGSILGP